MATVTYELLKRQDDRTSSTIIQLLTGNNTYDKMAKEATDAILTRDREDDEKLAKGIQISIDRGVIPSKIEVEPITKVTTIGKKADEVADEILAKLGDAVQKGCVVVFQGLSGTGKGTTVAKLKEKIGGKCVTWSNGNVFRTLTLLTVKHCEANGKEFSADVLTTELIGDMVKMLTFGKVGEGDSAKFDISIKGAGLDTTVGEIASTLLQEPSITKHIPTVAHQTQGDVINFGGKALGQLAEAGYTVLLEGREQTVNYIRTPYRFELVIPDTNILGQRRAAQRIMAQVLKDVDAVEGEKRAGYNDGEW
eukprot:TRINITY_DN67281_c2_g5_i1.p1 TRINITY_DN67281_c2_g5~~TRINITY_DN67281_c2_g5_i1.p1  ORF type:complete len:318 (+),score=38.97 TRINITY_DN67281_c2_g5_i1:33-956(+)